MGGLPIIYRSRDTVIAALGISFETTYGDYVKRDLADPSRYLLAYDADRLAQDFPDARDASRQGLMGLLGTTARSDTVPLQSIDPLPSITPSTATIVSEIATESGVSSSTDPIPSVDRPNVSSVPSILTSPSITPVHTNTFNLNAQIFDTFDTTKASIQELLKIKNPVTWILRANKIKDEIAQWLEDLADTLSEQFETSDNSEQVAFLVHLGLGKRKSDDVLDFYRDSKYFDEGFYFTVYAASDADFHHLIQKLASRNPSVSGVSSILGESRFAKYAGFLDFYERSVRPFLPQISENFRPVRLRDRETDFLDDCFSAMLSQGTARARTLWETWYGFFPLDMEAVKSMKFKKNSTIVSYAEDHSINRDTERMLREHPEIRRSVDDRLEHYTPTFEHAVEMRTKIDVMTAGLSPIIRESTLRYYREQVETRFYHSALSHGFIWNQIVTKTDEKRWLERRLNYRVKIRNDKTKSEAYRVMDSYNQFRKMILAIEDSFLSDVVKVFVYRFLSEKLALEPKAYKYLKYFLLYVLPRTYSEYVKIYTFFYELEAYKRGERMKISFFVMMVTVVVIGAIGIFYSALFMTGIVLYLAGMYAKRRNFFAPTPRLRLHGGFQLIGSLVIIAYMLLLLNHNGYIEFRSQLSVERNPNITKTLYYTLRDVPYNELSDTAEIMTANVRDALRKVNSNHTGMILSPGTFSSK